MSNRYRWYRFVIEPFSLEIKIYARSKKEARGRLFCYMCVA